MRYTFTNTYPVLIINNKIKTLTLSFEPVAIKFICTATAVIWPLCCRRQIDLTKGFSNLEPTKYAHTSQFPPPLTAIELEADTHRVPPASPVPFSACSIECDQEVYKGTMDKLQIECISDWTVELSSRFDLISGLKLKWYN